MRIIGPFGADVCPSPASPAEAGAQDTANGAYPGESMTRNPRRNRHEARFVYHRGMNHA